LPSDAEIVEWFYKISNLNWRWAYGMMATYGIRPHELFHLDTQDLEQGGYVLKVLENTKTGFREVRPYHLEWVDQFGLRQKRLPAINVIGKGNKRLGSKISAGFRRYKVPFRPYNLRHAYAVRCLRFDVDPSLAARWMGHTVAVHTRTYQAWISKDVEHEAFVKSIQNPNRPKPPATLPPSQQVVGSELAA
jgi:integrase